MNSEIINIIGSGSMGHLWAAYLSKSQFKINIITKHNTSQEKVLLEAPNCSFFFEANYQTYNDWQTPKLIIVCVKATSLGTVCKQLAAINDKHPPILLMMNGMGLSEIVNKYLPKAEIYQASITHGATYKLINSHKFPCIKHTGYGKTLIGEIESNKSPTKRENISNIISILNQSLPVTEWNLNQYQALWTKLVINAIINPLTAIYGVKNGEISSNYKLRQQAIKLTQELSPIIKINLPNETWQSVWKKVESVTQHTAENISSMYQDILNKQLTEIDYISGYLVNQGKRKGYQFNEHIKLIKQIKRLENDFYNPVTNRDPSSE